MTWREAPLIDLLELSVGGVWGKEPGADEVDVRIWRVTELKQGGRLDPSSAARRSIAKRQFISRSLRPGDLLLEKSGGGPKTPVGRVGLVTVVPEPAVCANFMQLLRPDPALIEPRFLHLFLNHFHLGGGTASMQVASTNIRNIKASEYVTVGVPLPSLDEQRRIVDILEDHLSRLDAGDLYLDSAGRRLVALRRSTLDEQFGVSGHDVRLGELVTGIEAGRSFGGSTGPACSDDWGIIKVSAMTWGEFRPQENKAVPAEQADPRYEIHEGDLLVSRANTGEYVGASVLVGPVRGRLLLSDKSLRLNVRPGVRPDWLWRALQSPSARGQMSALATGTKDSMRNISQKSLLQVRLPAHDSDHQRAAVNEFQAVEDALGVLALQLAGWHKGAFAMRRAMLAAAFSGRMTGRHTDQEVIEELVDE